MATHKYDRDFINVETNESQAICASKIENNSYVLDVGCSSGYTGEFLQTTKNCKLVGVEYDPQLIKIAKEKNVYQEIYALDLNNEVDALDDYKGKFDYILMADVLEHLIEPANVLDKMQKLLNDEGKIIISLPNITHASIKLNLLANEFLYTPTGLLDKTHLRFFTLNSIIDMVNNVGMRLDDIDFIYCQICSWCETVDLSQHPKSIIRHVTKSPESFIYQYILSVSKSEVDVIESNNLFVNSWRNDLMQRKVLRDFMCKKQPFRKIIRILTKLIGTYP